ncbi:unnamed protein product [Cyprideis torosa]|uniref:Putative alpha-L-fucosidase n=1 Tax=Cyprideis torosa TaxID=163714 RepID=A0A7R8WC71_9CRUS|nr:unnamed protein product [Cyprideis torosa]CAG0887102.1 unnamed protein product [Cyprideis torosa]
MKIPRFTPIHARCIVLFNLVSLATEAADSHYDATWMSLDKRVVPNWYDEAKFGIFIHWGVYSVPSTMSEWFWWEWQGAIPPSKTAVEFMDNNFSPKMTYQDFGPMFTAEFYDPVEWAKLFSASGAKYVVLTSKHHEGFTLWPSANSFGWNAMDVGPKRDLVGDLAEAIRKNPDIRFGLYHSMFEWFNPLFLEDKRTDFRTQKFVNSKTFPELIDIVKRYRPSVIWSDGTRYGNSDYWKSKEFLAWLYNESPVKHEVAVNDRWGNETSCRHGGYFTCSDRFNPGTLLHHKWENCFTIDRKSWGFRRDMLMKDVVSIEDLLKQLVTTVSCGGNFLLNVGPAHDGTIRPIFQERLLQMGEWLKINGDAIYGTKPWIYQNDTLTPDIWYTQKNGVVYGIVLSWPVRDSVITFGSICGQGKCGGVEVRMLGTDGQPLRYEVDIYGHLKVQPLPLSYQTSKWAWTYVFTGLQQIVEGDNEVRLNRFSCVRSTMLFQWHVIVFVMTSSRLSYSDYYLETYRKGLKDHKYEPTWESLDRRPTPPWYDEAKFGIFLHWGVYSVPSATSAWMWWYWKGPKPQNATVEYMEKNFKPGMTYQNFGPMFTAEFYDPVEWAKLFNASGAKYVVLTSKHHEGFTLWPSANSFGWNAMDVGPKRDLVGDLAVAIRNTTNLRFGLYHSLFEWFNPLYLEDKKSHFKTQTFVDTKTYPELIDIVQRYKPSIIWSDGDWEAKDDYWKSKEFLAWLFNESPVKDEVATNDRWGAGTTCKHGGYHTCSDKYNPGVLQSHKWENCLTVDRRAWGFRRTLRVEEVLTIQELIEQLVSTVSCGGNMLLNVGPAHDGTIRPIFQERLLQMGEWLKINGEAIYGTKPWIYQNDTLTPGIWYTQKDGMVYGILLKWPAKDSPVTFGSILGQRKNMGLIVRMLGSDGDLSWEVDEVGRLKVSPLPLSYQRSNWAWTFVFTGLRVPAEEENEVAQLL